MAIPAILAGASIAAPIVGGIIGGGKAAEEAAAARQAMMDALGRIERVDLPDIERMKLQLQASELVGELSPEMQQALLLGPTAQEQIQVDPRLRQAQMSALEKISGIAEQGGLSEADRMALEQIRRQTAAQDEAKQQQILQDMQARGQGGSGAELIARLKSAQSAADRASVEGMNIAQNAQARALQAMSQQAALGGQIRGQEYGEQSDLARARDVINQFNLQNQQNIQGSNISSKNQAAAANLAARQNIMDQTAALRNQQQQYNKELLQRQYENEMQKAQAMAGILGGVANQATQRAANVASQWGQIGQGAGSAFMGAANIFGGSSKKPTESKQS